jgi:hypothetical protein
MHILNLYVDCISLIYLLAKLQAHISKLLSIVLSLFIWLFLKVSRKASTLHLSDFWPAGAVFFWFQSSRSFVAAGATGTGHLEELH